MRILIIAIISLFSLTISAQTSPITKNTTVAVTNGNPNVKQLDSLTVRNIAKNVELALNKVDGSFWSFHRADSSYYQIGQSYKVYSAILTQTGTSAPTATVLKSDIKGTTIVWTRTSAGVYVATLTGAFTSAALVIGEAHSLNLGAGINCNYFTWTSENVMTLNTIRCSTDLNADIVGKIWVEIRVYY